MSFQLQFKQRRSLMDYIRGVSRNQVILFPEAVEDYTEDKFRERSIRIDWSRFAIPRRKHVKIPLVVIVHSRGRKLAYEHIYWDQA